MSEVSVAGAPRYTDAQIALFGTLGLVPWVRREDRGAVFGTAVRAPATEAPAAGVPVAGVPVSGEPTAVAAVVAAATPVPAAVEMPSPTPVPAAIPVPDGPAGFGDWLGAQPLAGFARRGEQRHQTGPEGSTLLVVAETSPDTVTLLPLEQREADLLDLMVRAIGLAPGDWSTAVLADPARDEAGGNAGSDAEPVPHVASLLADRRALLWLVRDAEGGTSHEGPSSDGFPDDGRSDDARRDSIDGVPVFRLPHPATLLAHPLRKRRAWQVLKAVRNLLAGTSV